MEMKIIDEENKILLDDGMSGWNKNKVRKKRKEREKNLEKEIELKFGFKIDIQKEKEIHSEYKITQGSTHAPIEGDLNFPSWLRLKYQKLHLNKKDDELTITYS